LSIEVKFTKQLQLEMFFRRRGDYWLHNTGRRLVLVLLFNSPAHIR